MRGKALGFISFCTLFAVKYFLHLQNDIEANTKNGLLYWYASEIFEIFHFFSNLVILQNDQTALKKWPKKEKAV